MKSSSLCFLAVALLVASSAAPQGDTEARAAVAGWSLFPSFAVGGIYDDNVLFSTRETGGVNYAQLTGSLGADYVGRRRRFAAGYSASSDIFPERLEVPTTVPSRQNATVQFSSQLNPRTSFNVDAGYLLSYNPGEILEETGIEVGRRRSERYSAGAGFSRGVTERHYLSVNYSGSYQVVGEDVVDDRRVSTLFHGVSVSWGQTYTVRSTGTLTYGAYSYENDRQSLVSGVQSTFLSHVLTYTWAYQLSVRSAISLSAGPRVIQQPTFGDVSDGLDLELSWRLVPEVIATFDYQWERSRFSVSYARTQNQSFGGTGRVDTQRLGLSFVVVPHWRLSITVAPGVYRNTQLGEAADTYRAAVNVRWQLARWLSFQARYGYSYQERLLILRDAPADIGEPRERNTGFVGIVLEKLIPLD